MPAGERPVLSGVQRPAPEELHIRPCHEEEDMSVRCDDMETTREVKLPAELRKKLEAVVPSPPRNKPWEEWEKKVVRDYAPKLGARRLVPFLPGRTAEAIQNQMVRMGIRWVGQ